MTLRSESNIRNQYFDSLRGIAIIAVVGIHAYNTTYNNLPALFCREALNFCVPLFLALSGFFLSSKTIKSKDQYFYFLRKQIPKIYIPCVLWSIPFVLLDDRTAEIRLITLFTCGYSVYYYIVLTIQYYIGLPLLQRLSNRFIYLFAILQILTTIGISYLSLFKSLHLPLTIDGGICLLWISFYFMGIILSRSTRTYSLKIPIFLIIIGILLSVVESQWLISLTGGGFGANKISSYIYSTGVILLLFNTKLEVKYNNSRCKSNRALHILGNLSFGIYLSHLYIINILRHYHVDNWAILWLMGLIISAGAVIVARKVLPYRILGCLGLK